MKRVTTRTVSIDAAPGAVFTLRNSTLGLRSEFNKANAALLSQIRELEIERAEITTEFNEAARFNKCRPCECEHAQEAEKKDPENPEKKLALGHSPMTGECLEDGCRCRAFKFDRDKDRRFAHISAELDRLYRDERAPALVRSYAVSVSGYEVNDQPATTVESFLAAADPTEVEQLAVEIDFSLRLKPKEVENLSSGTISGAVETGPATNGTAPPASETDSTLPAAA